MASDSIMGNLWSNRDFDYQEIFSGIRYTEFPEAFCDLRCMSVYISLSCKSTTNIVVWTEAKDYLGMDITGFESSIQIIVDCAEDGG
jgi:hypothetical protein